MSSITYTLISFEKEVYETALGRNYNLERNTNSSKVEVWIGTPIYVIGHNLLLVILLVRRCPQRELGSRQRGR